MLEYAQDNIDTLFFSAPYSTANINIKVSRACDVDRSPGSQIAVCLKSMQRATIMHVLTFTAVYASETQFDMEC